MARMVEQNKNHSSIIMWSTGNESCYGENHAEAMYGFMRCDRNGDNKVPKIAYQVLKNKIAEAKKLIK